MKEYDIITVPNPKLHEVTQKVTSFEKDSNELQMQIRRMVEVLREEGGIGLAANQLGYPNRVITIEFEELDKKKVEKRIPLTIFINPEIVEYTNEKECFEEGCLSVPKIELEVERPTKFKLKYQNENGRRLKTAPKGLLARILQHEIDHLNGIIFTERVKEQFFAKFPEFKNSKIAFFGSGEFGAIILEGLILLGFNLDIYTEQAKPAGRKQETKLTAVAQIAGKFGKRFIEIEESPALGSSSLKWNLLICADFGQKIPSSMLNNTINIHPSLLPKYRGPSPIQTAILNGDKETGVSIIKMTDEIDAGPVLAQMAIEIEPNDDYLTLRNRLATVGLKILIKTLPDIMTDKLQEVFQDEEKVIMTRKFTKADGEINWKKSAKYIERQIRAFYPWPGTYTLLDNKRLIIKQAHLEKDKLIIDIIQQEGKNSSTLKNFLNGYRGPKPDWFEKISIK